MFKNVMSSLTARDRQEAAVGTTSAPAKLRRAACRRASGDTNTLCNKSARPDDRDEQAASKQSADFSETSLRFGKLSGMQRGKKKLSSMMSILRLSTATSAPSEAKPNRRKPLTKARSEGAHASSRSKDENSVDNDDDDDDDDDDGQDDSYTSADEMSREMSLAGGEEQPVAADAAAKTKGATSARRRSSAARPQAGQEQLKMADKKYILPEEQCEIPTFLHTRNCDPYLIQETRRLLRERYAKSPDAFYDADYQRMLHDDWTVSRFLLRRRLDPRRTAKLMEECGRFRKQYKMSEVQLWEFPVEFHIAGGLFKYAPDRVGNVTMYMRVKMHRRVPEVSDIFKAFILCVLEQCDVANNGRGTAVVFDLSGCGLQNVDLGFLSWLLSSFRNYCPKGVSYILVYNLPWILNATCKLAMTWMSASNKRALRFVYGDEIENFIERSNLPDYLGGECKLDYRAIPAGSKPAVEVCERFDISREQALKIRELFREYLPEGYEFDARRAEANAKSAPAAAELDSGAKTGERQLELTGADSRAAAAIPMELVSQASRFIAH